ncbi:MAG: hypothetical protein M0R22_09380 [Dehalococcoidia bacterium]|nr:hypothetical protein [Dehalococcoidia bacterium]
MQQETARVVVTARPGADIALVVLEAAGTASEAQPGQFVMVRCGKLPLRRPLSVHAAGAGRVAVLFRVSGQGTTWLASREPGEMVDMTGPLGVGYRAPSTPSRVLLLAGGLGIAPLNFLASRLARSHDVLLVQGARTEGELYESASGVGRHLPGGGIPSSVRRLVTTDDGSAGARGSAVQAALPHLDWADRIYICGPVAMCSAARRCAEGGRGVAPEDGASLSTKAAQRLLDAEVSLELRMGCGVGACYACSIPTVRGRLKVCRDGPVFRFGDVFWEALTT